MRKVPECVLGMLGFGFLNRVMLFILGYHSLLQMRINGHRNPLKSNKYHCLESCLYQVVPISYDLQFDLNKLSCGWMNQNLIKREIKELRTESHPIGSAGSDITFPSSRLFTFWFSCGNHRVPVVGRYFTFFNWIIHFNIFL